VAPVRSPVDAHEWVSFEDRGEERTWLFDATFLTSSWTCIFGRGCQGVLTAPAPELVQGCCSYGAHFVDEEDLERVAAVAETLDHGQWQFAARARRAAHRHGPPAAAQWAAAIAKRTSAGATVTRLVDGACIFLNRPGFPGGAGCALHQAAVTRGQQPLELKPDVCWQLPLRREDHVGDDGHVTSVIRQWDRRNWGDGGAEFHWWCTDAPDAFVGRDLVYRSMRAELQALVGDTVYRDLVAVLEERARAASQRVPLPHPALRADPTGTRQAVSRRAGPARGRGAPG